ncbi:hypothetical protein LWC34_52760 [Kibdelosporangium philippinense]|uniref:Uncharacterized protein n=1 Tax=Kibdelosporangium philippinense TaxID=211113 RepID=A0ABS8ZUR8_9PSEU|nr:hypothetical protein [Kibdelosporangium philippinense]MCE7011429.1 hypothetical protein [Kibdelosporangium philippinense]
MPNIERQRSLTEVVDAATYADTDARRWTVRRFPAADHAAQLHDEQPPGLVRATVAISHDQTEVIVTEEWSDSDGSGYEPFGVVKNI